MRQSAPETEPETERQGMTMRALFARLSVAALVTFGSATVAMAQSPALERIVIPASTDSPLALTAFITRGAGQGPRPAIVALHGCGGMLTKGEPDARSRDWAERWAVAGYTVVFPESFLSRGLGSQCRVPFAARTAQTGVRAGDAIRVGMWLAAQPEIDAGRLALVGWSHGGSTVLATVARNRWAGKPPLFKAAIAFYPGCRSYAESTRWAPAVPVTILMGSADDWTPPEPCRTLAAKHSIPMTEYPGAFHGFDAPATPMRVLTGLAQTTNADNTARIGTDPAGRAAAIADVTRILEAAFR